MSFVHLELKALVYYASRFNGKLLGTEALIAEFEHITLGDAIRFEEDARREGMDVGRTDQRVYVKYKD